MRPDFQTVIKDLRLMERLVDFTPVVIGTPPLGITTHNSDIDIACYSAKLVNFERKVVSEFKGEKAFYCEQITTRNQPAKCAGFFSNTWEIELFCQTSYVKDQWGFRHYQVEKRLLQLAPQIRTRVLNLKMSGMKTEPAFAKLLGLTGDPYEAILSLEDYSDSCLTKLVETGNFSGL